MTTTTLDAYGAAAQTGPQKRVRVRRGVVTKANAMAAHANERAAVKAHKNAIQHARKAFHAQLGETSKKVAQMDVVTDGQRYHQAFFGNELLTPTEKQIILKHIDNYVASENARKTHHRLRDTRQDKLEKDYLKTELMPRLYELYRAQIVPQVLVDDIDQLRALYDMHEQVKANAPKLTEKRASWGRQLALGGASAAAIAIAIGSYAHNHDAAHDAKAATASVVKGKKGGQLDLRHVAMPQDPLVLQVDTGVKGDDINSLGKAVGFMNRYQIKPGFGGRARKIHDLDAMIADMEVRVESPRYAVKHDQYAAQLETLQAQRAKLGDMPLNDLPAVMVAAKAAVLLTDGKLNGSLQKYTPEQRMAMLLMFAREESGYNTGAKAGNKGNSARGWQQMQPATFFDAIAPHLDDVSAVDQAGTYKHLLEARNKIVDNYVRNHKKVKRADVLASQGLLTKAFRETTAEQRAIFARALVDQQAVAINGEELTNAGALISGIAALHNIDNASLFESIDPLTGSYHSHQLGAGGAQDFAVVMKNYRANHCDTPRADEAACAQVDQQYRDTLGWQMKSNPDVWLKQVATVDDKGVKHTKLAVKKPKEVVADLRAKFKPVHEAGMIIAKQVLAGSKHKPVAITAAAPGAHPVAAPLQLGQIDGKTVFVGAINSAEATQLAEANVKSTFTAKPKTMLASAETAAPKTKTAKKTLLATAAAPADTGKKAGFKGGSKLNRLAALQAETQAAVASAPVPAEPTFTAADLGAPVQPAADAKPLGDAVSAASDDLQKLQPERPVAPIAVVAPSAIAKLEPVS